MNHFNRLSNNPFLILRFGLAFVFIYAGVKSLTDPTAWIGFVPLWAENFISREMFLTVHGAAEIIMAIGLISGIWLPIFSGTAFLSLISIAVFYGVDEVTFRDVGLAAAALALFFQSLRLAGTN